MALSPVQPGSKRQKPSALQSFATAMGIINSLAGISGKVADVAGSIGGESGKAASGMLKMGATGPWDRSKYSLTQGSAGLLQPGIK